MATDTESPTAAVPAVAADGVTESTEVNYHGDLKETEDIPQSSTTKSAAQMTNDSINHSNTTETADSLNSSTNSSSSTTTNSFFSSPSMTIGFRNFTVEVKIPSKNAGGESTSRKILKSMTGEFKPGRLVAIMGASGSGKTTLLNVLSGRQSFEADCSGETLVNGNIVTNDVVKKISGFVHQDDVMLPTQTVRDYLMTAALLKLPDSISLDSKRARVEEVIEALKLGRCADTIIGQAGITKEKGISGGEKRRVSVAMELIMAPSVLFADELTTGLDQANAYSLIHLLRGLCHHFNRTIIATIHQPSSDIFQLFDDLYLIGEGEFVYQGPVANVVPYFDSLNYKCPKYTNPADFIFTKVLNIKKIKKLHDAEKLLGNSSNTSNKQLTNNNHSGNQLTGVNPVGEEEKKSNGSDKKLDGKPMEIEMGALDSAAREAKALAIEREERARLDGLVDAWQSSNQCKEIIHSVMNSSKGIIPVSAAAGHKSSFSTQFHLLFRRAWDNQMRNQLMLMAKVFQTVFISIILGLIYLRLGITQKSIQDRTGALFFLAVNGMFASVMGVQNTFIAEQLIFRREYQAELYGLPAYFFSRTAVEIPFRIICPLIGSTIVFFMMGFKETGESWIVFCLTFIILDFCGASLGILICTLFPVLEVAITVGPALILPLMLTSGYFRNLATLPPYFRWFAYFSPVKYAFVSLVKNEFAGRTLKCTSSEYTINNFGVSSCPKTTGEQVISAYSFDDEETIGIGLLILFVLTAGFIMLSYWILWRSLRKIR